MQGLGQRPKVCAARSNPQTNPHKSLDIANKYRRGRDDKGAAIIWGNIALGLPRERHTQPDWLLIYELYGKDLYLYLIRTGTHSDLFS